MRANQASPSIIENTPVQAYESTMKLQEVASITAPEPQQLVVQPWDVTLLKDIESALREHPMDLNPVVESEVIRIAFPPLTEEKRRELVKMMGEKVEQARISVRRMREDLLKEHKEAEKAGDLSKDEYFRKEKEVQEQVDAANTEIKNIADKKEQELMTV